MCIINLSIQVFLAGVHWVYIPEISNDNQFGLIATVHYSTAVYLSATLEYELEYFSPQGTMFFFAICNLAAFLFCTVLVKETQGLSDKEKKSLYMPKSLVVEQATEMTHQGSEIEIESIEETLGGVNVGPEQIISVLTQNTSGMITHQQND